MAGPFGRLVAQALVIAGSVVSRAFVQAYMQASQQARHTAKQTATKGQQAGKSNISLRKQIGEVEALKILNFSEAKRPKSVQEVIDRYEVYFNANNPKQGGSFYLQSKIYRAKERLEQDFNQSLEEKKEKKERKQ